MYKDENEIYHHGILGMRWGIRRYQNPDGSLTEAGRKRARKLKGEYNKLTGRKLKGGNEDFLRKSDAVRNTKNKDLNDFDLNYKINRLQREKTARDLERDVNYKPDNTAKETWKDVVKPAVKDAGRATLTKYLKVQLNSLIPKQPKTKEQLAKDEAAYTQNLLNIQRNKQNLEAEAYQFKYGKQYTKKGKVIPYNQLQALRDNIKNQIDEQKAKIIGNVKNVSVNLDAGWKDYKKYSVEPYFKKADSILTDPKTSTNLATNWMPDWLIKGNIT